ncbi:MAG: hypothetical protein IPI67_14605 [Myxococcales bacterium]|nr:hypothetical protein [Myxococcales bacterium]
MSFASKWLKLGVLTALVGLAGGCADEREPINKVQANALAKSFFVGDDLKTPEDDPEFYTAATITDVPYGADQAGVFPGLVGGLRRVKWEILEDVLNARMTYEEIEGSDGHGNRKTNTGRVIGSWHIKAHFDVKRAYNATTGEELNVIEENSSDRPWYERKYFRVDWSQNLVASSMGWDPIAQQGAFGDSLDTESLQYYVDDPNNPDAPHFDGKDGYFDVTNKLYLKPKMVTVFGQTVNACLYRGSIVIGATAPWGNCENSEVTIRYSFKKVAQPGDKNYTDYEPIHWDGSRMNSFGVFTQDRMGWDNRYGIIDNEWRRFAQRYNIWAQSHTTVECNTPAQLTAKLDPHTDADQNGTEDQCETAGIGSRCDDLSGLCTIPYAKRELRPVVWRYTVGPENDTVIFDATRRATFEWDIAIRGAVQAARLVECKRTAGKSAGLPDAAACAGQFPMKAGEEAADMAPTYASIRPMVVLCHNPVAEGDDGACGDIGMTVRPGDIRYHHVNVWPTRQNQSPWGYGPTLADPLTGEAISAGINVYNAVTDTAAQSFVDQLRWLNGELKSADISTGSYIRDWVSLDNDKGGQGARELAGGFKMTRAEINKRMAGIKGLNAEAVKPEAVAKAKALLDPRKVREDLKTDLWWNRLPPEVGGSGRAEFDQRINAAKGTKIEAQLMNSMWSQMAGVDPSKPVDDAVLEQASPLRGMRSHILREAEQQVHLNLAKHGQCIVGAPEPTGLPALSRVIKKKFPAGASETPGETKVRVDRMWDYLRGRMHYAVIAHEMGHTVGFRHNFVSSYDKFNWRPQYWQLRTDNDTVNEPCTDAVDDGKSCVGPRYWDPITKEEHDNSIYTWQHTTTMDYAGDLTQDMLGLGVYDYAGTRMFYGDVVDVMNDPAMVATVRNKDGEIVVEGTPAGNEVAGLVDFAGGLLGQVVARPDDNWGSNAEELMHYSEWNKWFHFIRDCKPADTSPPADWDAQKDGEYDPLFDGHIVKGTRCERAPVDYVGYTELLPDQLSDQTGTNPRFFTSRRARDLTGRPRMPYGFESDEYADGWSPSTYRHDNGGDLFEELTFHSNLYESRHIFDNFRNGRVNFTVYGAYQRALSRYHAKISGLTQGVAYVAGFYAHEYAKNLGIPLATILSAYFGQGGYFYDTGVGAALGFDHFARVLTRPHIGPHYAESSDPQSPLLPEDDVIGGVSAGAGIDPTLVDIPNGASVAASGDVSFGGKPLSNDFQFGQGYWTIDYLNQSGSYYEKTYAFEAMLEASYRSFNFWRFDGLDARFGHINYTDLWGDGMRRMIGSMLTGDRGLFAARVTSEPNGAPHIVETDSGPKYPESPLGWVSFISPNGPEICWPVNGTLLCQTALGDQVGGGNTLKGSRPVDPQLGYEVQKFILFWSYVYLPTAETWDWVDLMRMYKLGSDLDPGYLPKQRVEWRDPETGQRYLAKRYGDETLLGKKYDKGIAAKMVQWANTLTAEAYELDATTPFDPDTGAANIKLDSEGKPIYKGATICDDNKKCVELRLYRGLMDFARDTAATLGFPEPALQVYGGN